MLSQSLQALHKQVKENVLAKNSNIFLELDNVKRRIEQEEIIRQEVRALTGREDEAAENYVLSRLIGLGRIEPLFDDKWINEIMINGREVWIEKKGELIKTDIVFDSFDEVESLLQRIVQMAGRKIDWSNPVVDAKLPDGSRVNAVIKPSAEEPHITIRRFVQHSFSMDELVQQGYLSTEMAIFFKYAVKGRLNILLCGAAGSSKTTFARTLGSMIPHNERIVVIEDVKELNIEHPHVVPLEASNKADIYTLMVNALRMRPDRIILGECRGMETFELLQAMGTGHNGSITTTHCNNNKMDAVQRLMRAMLKSGMSDRELQAQVCNVIDLTVFIKKFRNGIWRITNVCEVVNKIGEPSFRDLYVYEHHAKKHKSVSTLSPESIDRIKDTLENQTLPNIMAFRGERDLVEGVAI